MASDLNAELLCCICQDYYTDPATLTCGHNFCRTCIERYLDSQQNIGVFTCPNCRAPFWGRPSLHVNTDLRNIVQRVHDRLNEQQMFGECPLHKQSLEYYCFQDTAPVCVSCILDDQHRGHEVKTLSEASEKKKENLRRLIQQLETEDETEQRVRNLQDHRRKVEEKSATLTESVTTLFQEIEVELAELKKQVLKDISKQEKRVSSSVSELIQQLEEKKDNLDRTRTYMEDLCNAMEPITVLLADEGDLSSGDDVAAGGDLATAGDLAMADDLDEDLIIDTLHRSLADLVNNVTNGIFGNQ